MGTGLIKNRTVPITLNTLLFQIVSRILLKLSPNGKKIAFTNF
jgi:hypothetical protein